MTEKSPEILIDRFRVIRILNSNAPVGTRRVLDRENDCRVIPINSVRYHIAQSREDLAGAFGLLQRRYRESGLASNQAEMRVLPYHLLDQTQVIVGVQRKQVVGTVSLVSDVPNRLLPMESMYAKQIERLRARGLRLGEVCSLTAEPVEKSVSAGEVFSQLTRLLVYHARHIGIEHLVAIVHPRHAKFYERAMGFKKIGGLATCDHVGGLPGIPLLGNIADRSRFRSRWQKFYFDSDFDPMELKPSKLSPVDRSYFQQYLPSVYSACAPDRQAA